MGPRRFVVLAVLQKRAERKNPQSAAGSTGPLEGGGGGRTWNQRDPDLPPFCQWSVRLAFARRPVGVALHGLLRGDEPRDSWVAGTDAFDFSGIGSGAGR